ncbi:unnamed protein product [Knipowitschia caucasica]
MSNAHTLTHNTLTANCNEDALATDSLLGLIEDRIRELEDGDRPNTGTYLAYENEAYRKMPTIVCEIEGKPITFLVDSGATHSVIQTKELSIKLSGRSVFSTSASGQTVPESFSVPIKCTWANERNPATAKHSFLMSDLCPVNLLGRDLMIKWEVVITSTAEGLKIDRGACATNFVKVNTNCPMSVYQWWFHTASASYLMETTSPFLNPKSDTLKAEDLHCVCHLHHGPDCEFEETFKLGTNGCLILADVYFDESKCAVSVELSQSQKQCYRLENSSPHISIAKAKTDTWQTLGLFVRRCTLAEDWEACERGENVFYSQSVCAYKMSHTKTVDVLNSVLLTSSYDDNDGPNLTLTSLTSPLEISPLLSQVPDSLWAKSKHDVGLIKNCPPVRIEAKSDYRPRQRQYPLRQEAIEGITPVFESFLEAGIIVPCEDSPVQTPIFPVKKIRPADKPTEWRFVQDLKAVNAAIISPVPNVPNPHTLLSQIPADAEWFSVVDLSNAFFSVPVDRDSQFWFAFCFNGKRYTFTRLCQGLNSSPSLFCEALNHSLASLVLTDGTLLINYVDDLMIASPTKEQCEEDTIKLLQHLAEEGHKASVSKLQFVKQNVVFLGHIITPEGKTLSQKRVTAIVDAPKPSNKKELLSFLGMCSYCRHFIANFSEKDKPLRDMTVGRNMCASSPLVWTPEAEQAFTDLKIALQSAPTLGIPDPNKPFVQFVDERCGCMTSVLLQKHGDLLKPVGYFSKLLDPVARGLPACLRAIAACETAVLASRDFVGFCQLFLFVPHSVALILQEQKSSHLSASRWLRYHTTLLGLPHVTVHKCSTLNPATLLPLPGEGTPHSCMAELNQICTPRPDLSDTPLTNPDLILYVDGSAYRDPDTGRSHAGYAVVDDHSVVLSSSLPSMYSAQLAELVALTEACAYAKGRSVTIFTDSRYAFGVTHDFGALWKHRNFLKSDGKPILHHTHVAALLEAILLPSQIAVCKCSAHTGATDSVSLGNARADRAARAAAKQLLPSSASFSLPHAVPPETPPLSPPASLKDLCSLSSPEERRTWAESGAVFQNGVWVGPDLKPCLPKRLFNCYAKLTHGLDHVSKGNMFQAVQQFWFTKGFSTFAAEFCRSCLICAQNNPGRPRSLAQVAHPAPTRPFEHVMMDFIELTPSEGKKFCLVMVDMFSKWVEAFPAKHASSATVAKAILTEILVKWGIPQKLSSDNGSHFVNEVIKQLSDYLKFDLKTHCSYHPQSGGAVERENFTIKSKLAKCCQETNLSWPKCLPIVLMYMRMRVRTRNNLSPFEILFAAPPNVGMGPAGPQPDAILCEDGMIRYCITLTKSLSDIRRQVSSALPQRADHPLHNIQPGDFVLIRNFKPKSWNHHRWLGPFQVLLVTHTAVKVQERQTWVHASHCKQVPALLAKRTTEA